MTSLIPLYLKTTYKKDPIFKNTKSVFSVYDSRFTHKFDSDMLSKIKMIDIDDNILKPMANNCDYDGFIKMGMQYADAVVRGNHNIDGMENLFDEIKPNKTLSLNIEEGDDSETYYNLYNELAG
jgi:starch synthase